MARHSLLPLATLLVALLTVPGVSWCLVQVCSRVPRLLTLPHVGAAPPLLPSAARLLPGLDISPGPVSGFLAHHSSSCTAMQELSQQEDQPRQETEQLWRPTGGARSLLQGAGDADALTAGDDARRVDTTVEDGILQTHAPPADRQARQRLAGEAGRAQQQAQQQEDADVLQERAAQQARRLREEKAARERSAQAKAAQEADHSRQLDRQRREAAQARDRLAALQQEDRQQQSLGRGSLRARKLPTSTQPLVSGSNKNDIFAQHTERRLAAARERFAAQRSALAAARAAQGQARQQQGQQQEAGGAAGQRDRQVPAARHMGAAPRRRHQSIPLPVIVAMTLAMAAAAGLGALPFFFVRSMSPRATGVATAIACGVMLAASFDLVHDGGWCAAPPAAACPGGCGVLWVSRTCCREERGGFAACCVHVERPSTEQQQGLRTERPVARNLPCPCRPALRRGPDGGWRAAGRLVHQVGAGEAGCVRGHHLWLAAGLLGWVLGWRGMGGDTALAHGPPTLPACLPFDALVRMHEVCRADAGTAMEVCCSVLACVAATLKDLRFAPCLPVQPARRC